MSKSPAPNHEHDTPTKLPAGLRTLEPSQTDSAPRTTDDGSSRGSVSRIPQVGDWISYTAADRVMYSRVEYVRTQSYWPRQQEFITTHGVAVVLDRVLEIRSAGVRPIR